LNRLQLIAKKSSVIPQQSTALIWTLRRKSTEVAVVVPNTEVSVVVTIAT
jgi:hypothetical protein